MPANRSRVPAAPLAWALLTGCSGPQSALAPAGRHAEVIAELFWWSVAGAVVVWLAVAGLATWAAVTPPIRNWGEGSAHRLIVLGAIFPTVVLTLYLTRGLSLLPSLLEPAPPDALRIEVVGRQWWWQVRYLPPGGAPIPLANEIRLPVGRPVELRLDSADVIHAFWIPALGGKMDMIPGRTTRMTLEARRAGTFRGVCAEYCGTSHALMAFPAVAMEAGEFERWLAAQAAPAVEPRDPLAIRGREIFLSVGCGACHAVRGTPADGRIGPDLTHVGSRIGLGAGILPNDREGFVRWLAETAALKPEVHMPSFGMLPPEALQALAAYLDGLE